jgi:hypothetical protein
MNFESAQMKFPTAGLGVAGYTAGGDAGNKRATLGVENLSWGYQTLPFMEANNLYDLRRTIGMAATNADGTYVLGEEVPNMSCPSRSERYYTAGSPGKHFIADYASFILDTAHVAAIPAPRPPSIPSGGSVTSESANDRSEVWVGLISKGGTYNTDDTVRKWGKVGFGNITDGSSNTLMLAEKGASSDEYNTTNPREEDGIYKGGWSQVRGWKLGVKSDSFRDGDYKNDLLQGFSAAHPGTVNVVLGDGSTHAISENVSPLNFYKLGHRSDGLILDDDVL